MHWGGGVLSPAMIRLIFSDFERHVKQASSTLSDLLCGAHRGISQAWLELNNTNTPFDLFPCDQGIELCSA